MPRVGVRRIRGGGWSLEPKEYEKALRRTMNEVVKKDVLKMFKEVVEGKRYSNRGEAWEHKVQFRARFQMRGDEAVLYVFPFGRNKAIWQYVSGGTRPHKIRATNAPFLHFPYGGMEQQPKTPPRPGGPGVIRMAGETKWARVVEVDHPGTDPRDFEGRILKEYSGEFRKHIKRTIDQVIARKNRRTGRAPA